MCALKRFFKSDCFIKLEKTRSRRVFVCFYCKSKISVVQSNEKDGYCNQHGNRVFFLRQHCHGSAYLSLNTGLEVLPQQSWSIRRSILRFTIPATSARKSHNSISPHLLPRRDTLFMFVIITLLTMIRCGNIEPITT